VRVRSRSSVAMYTSVAVTYSSGKQLFTRGNVLKFAWGFLASHLPHLDPLPNVPRTLLWMLQSKLYVPATSWVTPTASHYLHPDAVQLFWMLIHYPEKAAMTDVKAMFFMWRRGDPREPADHEVPTSPNPYDAHWRTRRWETRNEPTTEVRFETEILYNADGGIRPYPLHTMDAPYMRRFWPDEDTDPYDAYCGVDFAQAKAMSIAAATSDEDDAASLHTSDDDAFDYVAPASPRTPVHSPARSPAGPHLEITDSERSPRRSLSFSPAAINSPAFSPD
jgi:hypothetical protein